MIFKDIHERKQNWKFVDTLYSQSMYEFMKAVVAHMQVRHETDSRSEKRLWYYDRRWKGLDVTDCNPRKADRLTESIWNYNQERGINVDNIPEVKGEIINILMNPTGLAIDPNNGMICINDFLRELNNKTAIRAKYPSGMLELDIALMGIREWLLSDRAPWFVVAHIDEDDYKKVLQKQSTKKCYSIHSIRLPHVSSLQRCLHPARCLLPELHVHREIGEYVFVLTSNLEARQRAMDGNVVQSCDLFSFKIPNKKEMDMAQTIKLVNDPIDAILVVNIATLLRDVRPAPQFYMAGSILGWLQWTFTCSAEKIPRHIWLQILRNADGGWYVFWQKPDPVQMTVNRREDFTRKGCFSSRQNASTLVIKRREHRTILPRGVDTLQMWQLYSRLNANSLPRLWPDHRRAT